MTTDRPEAVSITRRQAKELTDGTLRVSIDIDPQFKADFHRLFPDIDMPGALVPLVADFERIPATPDPATTQAELGDGDYPPPDYPKFGEIAVALKLSNFFRSPAVWKAVGTEYELNSYVRTLNCKGIGDVCSTDIIASCSLHGYSAIPLCSLHHEQRVNQGGRSIAASEIMDKWRIETVSGWAWASLKAQLGFDSWSKIAPSILREWANKNGVANYLPEAYR